MDIHVIFWYQWCHPTMHLKGPMFTFLSTPVSLPLILTPLKNMGPHDWVCLHGLEHKSNWEEVQSIPHFVLWHQFMILCECSLPLHPSVVKWIYRFFPDLNVCLYTHMLYVTMIIGSGAMKFSLDPLCIVEIPYNFMSDMKEHVHRMWFLKNGGCIEKFKCIGNPMVWLPIRETLLKMSTVL